MQSILTFSSRTSTEVAHQAGELLHTALLRMALAAGGLGLLAFVALVATWPLYFRWNIAPPFLALWLACLAAVLLGRRAYLAALAAWLTGLAVVALLAAVAFNAPEPVLILGMLPLLAGLTASWPGSLAGGGLVALALALAPLLPDFPILPQGYPATALVIAFFCGLAGWAATSALVTALEWSLFSYHKMQANLEETRQHRAQLSRALKDLDHANYLLERTNASLVAARRAAEAAERFKAEFVANVSHELRTPLNLIIGFSEVMVTSPESYGGARLPGVYRSDILAIYQSARHLLALVDDVLDLGRIDANKVALVPAEVGLPDLVGEVDGMVREYINAKGLKFQVNLAPDLPPLWIDRLRIRQVLLNLLVNAARFTEQGSIRLEVQTRDGEVLFRVQDTGRGISSQDLPHIFDPFHTTGGQEEGPWHSGTGLGLPISKKFVELHGGRMGVESIPLHGTCFWFTLSPGLPGLAKKTHDMLPGAGEFPARTAAGTSTAAASSTQRQPITGPPERIVMVASEDGRLPGLLQRQVSGYSFRGAAGLAEGIRQAGELRAAALLVDRPLPAEELPGGLPVIRLPWPGSRAAAAALGGSDLLALPVTPAQLLAAVDRLVGANPPRQVLIVGSDPELVRLFRRILRARWALPDLLEAYNGDEALERITVERPGLVILDLDLPGPAVREVMTRLHPLSGEDTGLADIPVILIGDAGREEMDLPLTSPLEVTRQGGLRLGEASRMLQGVLEALEN